MTASVNQLRAYPKAQGPIILAQSGVASSVTGTTSETTLATITVPGGMMGVNGVLRVSALFSMTSSANNKTVAVKLAGNAVASSVVTTSAAIEIIKHVRNKNSQSSQAVHNSALIGSGSSAATTTLSVDTSTDQTLIFTGTLANTGETITLLGYTVEVLPS